MTDDLVAMARLAQRDERMSTGALYGDLADRIEELEAKLAKAVEVLSDLVDCVDDGCFCSEVRMAAVMDYAYITLAELTGGQDG